MGNTIRLFSSLEKIKRSLEDKSVYLFLDYDGTLAPIAQSPDKAVMPEETAGLLRQLAKTPGCNMAIVSGRSLKDISKRVDLKGIVYVGNHGFEIKGPKIDFKSPVSPVCRKALEEIRSEFGEKLSSIKGVIIEHKGPSISVHYRLVDKKEVPLLKAVFHSIVLPYEARKEVVIKKGKMVFEIMPPAAWDKGKAVLWLLTRYRSALKDKKNRVVPIYVGDDATDEDAFRALGERGITVFVGRLKKTNARFYLKDSSEAALFLRSIRDTLTGGYHERDDRE